jgi:tetratricopeptide (TPR) repeat protein
MHILDMGTVFFMQEEYEKAVDYFNWALDARQKSVEKMDDPDSAKIFYYLGKTLLAQNRIEDAENYLNSALKIFETKLPAEHLLVKDCQSALERTKPEVEQVEKDPQIEKQTEST